MSARQITGAGQGVCRSSSQFEALEARLNMAGSNLSLIKSNPRDDTIQLDFIKDEQRQTELYRLLGGCGDDTLGPYAQFVVDTKANRVVAALRNRCEDRRLFLEAFPALLQANNLTPNPDPLGYVILDNPKPSAPA